MVCEHRYLAGDDMSKATLWAQLRRLEARQASAIWRVFYTPDNVSFHLTSEMAAPVLTRADVDCARLTNPVIIAEYRDKPNTTGYDPNS